MARILDERDRKEIEEYAEQRDKELSAQYNEALNSLEETLKDADEAIAITMANEDQALSDKIQELATDTTEKITNLNEKVDDNQTSMTEKVETLEDDLTSQINTLDEDINNKVDTLNSNMIDKVDTLEENIASNMSDLENDIAAQINDLDSTKVDKDGDKVLSENDLTDELKENYDTSYEHSQQAHAPSDAEMNVQANWAEEDSTADSYIQNKPTLGTMAAKSVVEKSDLSADVQASLELAEGSLQPNALVLRVSDGYIQYTTDSETWNDLIPVAELSGFNLHADDAGVVYFG